MIIQMRSLFSVPVLLLLAACGVNKTINSGEGWEGGLKSLDQDGDGYSPQNGDCNDADAAINPGAPELCDTVDNDCDGDVDDDDSWHVDNYWAPDMDGDGYPDNAGIIMACSATSLQDLMDYVGSNVDLGNWIQPTVYEDTDNDGLVDSPVWDCDDANSASFPGNPEICDTVDNDCNGLVDDGAVQSVWYVDGDGDSYGDSASAYMACTAPMGYVAMAGDCNDSEASINPGAQEICDTVDNDCDGDIDDADSSVSGQTTWYLDADTDNYGDSAMAATLCIAPMGYVAMGGDCNDANAAINPGAQEICDANSTDEDCDGAADDADSSASGKTTWYRDYDGDSYGRSDWSFTACNGITGYTGQDSDCNDANAAINPGATEIPGDGIDNDCDGADSEPVACNIELQYDSTDVYVTEMSVVGTPGGAYDGDIVAGVTGWSFSEANRGSLQFATGTNGSFCLTGNILVHVVLSDGSPGCMLNGTASGDLFAMQDGITLVTRAFDNGDGTCDIEIVK